MHGLDEYDYGARGMFLAIGRFTTVDPLCEKHYSVSPYAYCAGNPMNRIDPDGMKDTTYVAGKDKPVSDQPGTATPVTLIYDKDGNIVGVTPESKNAYNCHSYAWENSKGDPTDPRNSSLVNAGVTKWDENPDNNMKGYTQLNSNDPNKKGDRVIYYIDSNGNGKYDVSENIEHSAVVQTVDKNGNTTTVIGKRGQLGISENHPTAPGYYDKDLSGNSTSRAYFRSSTVSSSVPSSTTYSLPTLKVQPYIAPRNATYVAHPVVTQNILMRR